ncbi:mitochondrial carrier domain-containing protein [Halteromyces radiatus]|uniref:mitochondrial carrier domain-containing protein n=1 Tax=Halteromyces radiatus TaxID=101107 RepID=UPI00221FB2FE|nr:mitochondrial carrier domain-containing protein [Halteromyces radiatus]KAI8078784.1 mitochondrial carrier domain-containing protein [Halteromyces radiatus]
MSSGKDGIVPFEQYKLPPVGHAISGAVASILSNMIIYPIDISTTRLQLEQKKEGHSKGLVSMMRQIYQEGGIEGLYRGLGADNVATVLSSFIYFYCYTALRNMQEKFNTSMGKSTATLNIYQELFLGAEAALISRFFTSPVSNITTRLQTSQQVSFMDVVKDIYNEKKITGFWTGYRASIILVSNPSITYFVFEQLKSFYLRTHNKTTLTSVQTFLFSALAKSMATMITYPFIFVRANMIGSKKGEQDQSMMTLFKQVIEKEGITGIYKGMKAQIIKGFFNSGILFMIKDYVATYLAFVFYASYKLKMKRRIIQ